jgi:hypothetical protein
MERLIKLAEQYDPKTAEKVIMGRVLDVTINGEDSVAIPAAKLAGSHKALNLWSPDQALGVQVNVQLLESLEPSEGIVITPKD